MGSSLSDGMPTHKGAVEHRVNLMCRTKVAIGMIGNDRQLGIVRMKAVEYAGRNHKHGAR